MAKVSKYEMIYLLIFVHYVDFCGNKMFNLPIA